MHLDVYPREMEAYVHTKTCILMFVKVSFTIANKWKEPKSPSTDQWTNKMWCIQTMEPYSAIRRKEAVTHTTPWMNCENT